jgi:ADP-ribosyl-[dinitrogen reductase] hydrolase
MPLHGSCLCGTVRYEADQLDAPIVHCHCATCRKAHAAAFNSSAGVERRHFRWTAGEDKLTRYASSPDKNRWFCSLCGSQMIAEFPAKSHVLLRVATLDDDPGVRPTAHIWTSEHAPWLVDDAAVARHPKSRANH